MCGDDDVVDSCREARERNFGLAGNDVFLYHHASVGVDDGHRGVVFAREGEVDVGLGDGGADLQVVAVGLVDAHAAEPEGEVGGASLGEDGLAGVVDGVVAGAAMAPAHEGASLLVEGALGEGVAGGGAEVVDPRRDIGDVRVEEHALLVDDFEVVVEDGVEVAQEGVHFGHAEVVLAEFDVARVAADGVVVVDGVEGLHLAGTDAEDGALALVEGVGGVAAGAAVGTGSKVVDGVESVAVAAPAPVEVVAVFDVGAVEDERMSAGAVGAGVVHGLSEGKVLVDECAPAGFVIGVAVGVVEGGVVFEVQFEGLGGAGAGPVAAFTVGAATADGGGAVHHVHGHAAVVGDGGHGIFLVRHAEVLEAVRHELPEVGGVAEVDALPRQAGAAKGYIGVGVLSVAGVVPVLHDLGHGSGHAAHDGASVADGVVGAIHIVRFALVPLGLQHLRHGGEVACGVGLGVGAFAVNQVGKQEFPPLLEDAFALGIVVFDCFGNLVVVALEPVGDVAVERGGEGVVEGIGQDGHHAVVGRDDDEAQTLHVEDVELVQLGETEGLGRYLGFDVAGAVLGPEGGGHSAGGGTRHRTGGGAGGQDKDGGYEKNCLFHFFYCVECLFLEVGFALVEPVDEVLHVAVVFVVLFGECAAVGVDDDVVGLGVHVVGLALVVTVAAAEGLEDVAFVVGHPLALGQFDGVLVAEE